MLLIKQADENWYGEVKTTLINGHLNPNSSDCHFPKTLQDALRLLKGYTSTGNSRMNNNNNNNDNREGMAFVHQDSFGAQLL